MANALYPTITLTQEKELSKLCLTDYGNGKWNHASLGMAGFINDIGGGDKAELKRLVSTAISLLSSMVACAEDHTLTSSEAVRLAREALEKL